MKLNNPLDKDYVTMRTKCACSSGLLLHPRNNLVKNSLENSRFLYSSIDEAIDILHSLNENSSLNTYLRQQNSIIQNGTFIEIW